MVIMPTRIDLIKRMLVPLEESSLDHRQFAHCGRGSPVNLQHILILLVLFVHIAAWLLAQIMRRIVVVGLAVFLVVGCLALLRS